MTLDIARIVKATGATVFRPAADGSLHPGDLHLVDLQRELRRVVVHSRDAGPDALFVALPGERVDGHSFVFQALASGARACLVSDLAAVGSQLLSSRSQSSTDGSETEASVRVTNSQYLLLVPDTLRALQRLAAFWRDQASADIIGITGSIGKTSTKEIVASLLAHGRTVLKSEGNFNTEIGLPLTLLKLRSEHRAVVLEMGMYVLGDVALLATIARPSIGIVTNVEPIHIERAGSIERIAKTKSELIAALPADGLAILNGDNPWTRAMAGASGIARTLLVGMAADCDLRAESVESLGLDGMTFTVRSEGTSRRLKASIPGTHHLHGFLAAICVARELGTDWPEIDSAVSRAEINVRQRLILDRAGMLIIDDTYNAAPSSMRAALALLRLAPGTKVAVLGDMLELGPAESQAHREVGEDAAGSADWLVTVGPRGAWIAEAAESAGLPARRVLRAENNEEASGQVERIVAVAPVTAGSSGGHKMLTAAGATGAVQWSVLVKGSRGMEMEEIVEMLRDRR
jgi:UDP-N-acetylmuramoyl-tripeptide--D-alanyl-D-alanine ligase